MGYGKHIEMSLEKIVKVYEHGKTIDFVVNATDADYSTIYWHYRDNGNDRLRELSQDEMYMFLCWVLMSEGRM